MEAHSFRRNLVRSSQRTCLKTLARLAVVVLFFFLIPTQQVFADYGNYLTLFKGLSSNPSPTLTVPSTIRRSYTNQGAAIHDFKFNFQGAFKTTNDRNASWHWNHIRKNEPASFIVRICDVDATSGTILSEDTCIYTIAPSAERVTNTDIRVTGEPMCKQVNGTNVCTLPNTTEAWPKIYNYNAEVIKSQVTTGGNGMGVGSTTTTTNNDTITVTDLDKPRYQFNVIFGSNTFKNITDGSAVDMVAKFKIGSTTLYKADIWYCGTGGGGDSITDNVTATYNGSDQVKLFNNLCGGNRPYFKIATSDQFQMPATLASAIAQTGAIDTTGGSTANTNTKEPPASSLPHCGILNGALGTSGSFVGCFAWITYYVIYTPVKWFAGLLGMLFDFFLGYSLSDTSYRAEFAIRGWQIVRDISNIFFIIILVWTGLSTVFGGGVNMKKVVSNLILNALIINFSLFGTRVIIDISNVVARVFYKSVHVCEGPCEKNADGTFKNLKTGPGGVTPLSEKIIGSFNPQKIFSTAILNSDNATKSNITGGVNGNTVRTNADGDVITDTDDQEDPLDRNDYATYFIVVSLIATAILVAVAMMFWKTAFFFLGRVIGLYIAMIFAPFAVLTRGNMPLVGGIKDLSWDNWLKDLTNYAMLAPIFVFFLYVIYSFLDTDFLKISFGDLNNASFMTMVISITVPMLIVYFMIQQGVKIAEKYAGKIGEMVQSGAMKVAGLAGGVALGGTALMGGRLLGAGANVLNKSRVGAKLRDAAPNSWLARKALGGLNSASAGSYDVRQTSLGKNLFKQMGIDTNQKSLNALKGVGLGLGTDQRKGGFEADVKRRKESREKDAKLFEEKMSDKDIEKYNEKQKAKRDKKVDKIVDTAIAAKSGKTKADIEAMKTTDKAAYDAERAAVMSDAKTKEALSKVTPVTEMKSTKAVNKDRKQKYVESLQQGSLLGKVPVIGDIAGARVRDTGDAQAAGSFKKELEKGDKEAKTKEKTEQLIKDLDAELVKTEAEFAHITEKLTELLKNEATKHADYAGKDITQLTEDEKADLLDRRELDMSGGLAVAQATYEKAVKDFQKTNTPANNARVKAAKIAMMKLEQDIAKGKNLSEKQGKLRNNSAKITKDKIQAEDRLENMEYRKERKAGEEKKKEGAEKKPDEAKPAGK